MIAIESGKYYNDIESYNDKYLNVHDGFAAFFSRVLHEQSTQE